MSDSESFHNSQEISKIGNFIEATENAGLELNGPMRKGGKCRNGITKPACIYETSSERNRR